MGAQASPEVRSKPARDALASRAAAGTFWSLADQVGRQAGSFLVFLVLARLLSPTDYGLVALATIFTSLIQILQSQGLGDAIVQRHSLSRGHLHTAFWILLGVGSLGMMTGIAVAPAVGWMFREPRVVPVLQVLSVGILISAAASVPEALLRRELMFRGLAIRSFASVLVGAAVGMWLAVNGYGVWALVGSAIAGSLAGLIAVWFGSTYRPELAFSRELGRELYRFGIHVLGSRVLEFLSRRLDQLLIGFAFGSAVLGVYSVAFRILDMVLDLLVKTIQRVAFPLFARLHGDLEGRREWFYSVTQLVSVTAMPAFAGILALADEIVRVGFGGRWDASAPVLRILSLMGIVSSWLYFNGAVVMSAGKSRWQFLLLVYRTIASAVLFVGALPLGLTAVAFAFVVRVYITAPVALYLVHKVITLDVRRYLRNFASPGFASVVMVVAIVVMRWTIPTPMSPFWLAVHVAVGAATYVLTLAAVDWRLLTRTFGVAMRVLGRKAPC